MNNVIQIGQAVQPSVLSKVEGTVKNLEAWLSASSASFSAIAGEKVSRLDVVKAHLYLAFLAAVMFIVSSMGGGMNMEYTEYMEKRHALEARMADMKMEARQKSRERSLLLEQQTSELRDRYFQEKRELESQCSADCEVIRHQYGTKKHDLFVQMGQLENEWRKTHPLPAAVINKAYELLMEEGGEA